MELFRSQVGGHSHPLTSMCGEAIVIIKYEPMIIQSYGLEPGAAQRLNTEGRIILEVSPTLRANAGDNQVAAIITSDEEQDNDLRL